MDDDVIRPVGASDAYPVILTSDGRPRPSVKQPARHSAKPSGKRRRAATEQSEKPAGGGEKAATEQEEGHVDRYG